MLKVRDIKIGEGIPKIIVPLMGETAEELLTEVRAVKELVPDMVEWRADKYNEVKNIEKVKMMLSQLDEQLGRIPLLFTFRTIKEGGDTEIKENAYTDLLQAVIESNNIDLVDIEYTLTKENRNILVNYSKKHGIFVVMSSHDFKSTPNEGSIVSILAEMIDAGADLPKIAVMPNGIEDVFILLQATNIMKKKYPAHPIITMAMGKYGLISRLAGEVFGSDATFGAGRKASAPGQIHVADLRAVLKVIHQNS